MSYLLDTCAVSEWAKLRPNPGWLDWSARVPESSLHLSVVTIAESRFGVERLHAGAPRDRLQRWLASLPSQFGERLLGVDLTVANAWGRLVARRTALGRPIGALDAMIAATAQAHGLALITREVGGFQDCGVDLVNPWS